jgi:hypothetical protein
MKWSIAVVLDNATTTPHGGIEALYAAEYGCSISALATMPHLRMRESAKNGGLNLWQ